MESSHWASQLWHIIPVFLNITSVKLITPAERVGWRCRMMKGMIFNGNKSTKQHTRTVKQKKHTEIFFFSLCWLILLNGLSSGRCIFNVTYWRTVMPELGFTCDLGMLQFWSATASTPLLHHGYTMCICYDYFTYNRKLLSGGLC